MTSGIYCISFSGTNSVYIGQSINIEKRWKEHTASLINNTANFKLLEAYRVYGEPSYDILVKATKAELDNLEISLIREFDSINNGFNILSGGSGNGIGENNSNSKYSNEFIINVFKLVLNPQLSHAQIHKITGISYSSIGSIVDGSNHAWLRSMFPEDYSKLKDISREREKFKAINLSNSRTSEALGKVFPILIGPDGTEYNVTNAKEFSISHGLSRGCLSMVLNKKQKYHKGYKLKEENDKP